MNKFSQAAIAEAAEQSRTEQREEYEQWLDAYEATLPPRVEKEEFLIQFPAQKFAIGTLPGYLYCADSYQDAQNAFDAGGKDVSDSAAAWADYEAYLQEEYALRA